MTSPAHRIFVSHSHLDNDFGTKLAQELRRVLKDESAVFYDVLGGLHGGERWWEKIVEELTASNIFLLVLSPEAMNSIWVRREIDVALNENKHIIPLLYRTCTVRADLKILQIISFLAPKSYETAFQEVLRALGLPTEAPKVPKVEVSPSGDPATILRQHIEVAFAEQDWPDVIRKADYLIKYIPSAATSPVHRWRGLALLEEGDIPQAQEALEIALALATNRELRITLLSDYTALLARQDQWAKVLQRTREALRLVPNDPGWLATQQQAQNQLSQQPATLSVPKEQVSPKEQQPALPVQKTREQWLEEGNTLTTLKRYDEALVAFDQGIRLDPNYATLHTNKGNILRSLNRNEEALAAFEQAIRLNPNNADHYLGRGLALCDLKRYLEALVDYEQAIQLKPQYALAYHEKGKALSLLKRYDEALVAFEQAKKLDPSYTGSYTEVLELLRNSKVTPLSPQSASTSISDQDRFDKFTELARKVLSLAEEEARRVQNNYIGTEHLLLGLVRQDQGVAIKVLSNLGVDLNKVRSAVEFIIARGDRIVVKGEIGLTLRGKKVIELAVDEARRLKHQYIGTEHLLLGLVREGEGIAAGVLESMGVNLEKVRTQIILVLSQPITPQKTQEQQLTSQPILANIYDQVRFDKLTEGACKVLSLALEESQGFQHNYIGTEHLLLGLVREGEGVAAKVLSNLGVELNKVRSAVGFIIGRGDRIVPSNEITLTLRIKKVIELAVDEARRLNHPYVGTEHLLLGLIREGEGIAAGVLESQGINLERVRTQTIQALSQSSTPQKTQEQLLTDALESVIHEKDVAIQQQDYELAADLRDREVKLRDRQARLKRS